MDASTSKAVATIGNRAAAPPIRAIPLKNGRSDHTIFAAGRQTAQYAGQTDRMMAIAEP